MDPNPTRTALLLIDMENGFLSPESALCVPGALETVPACQRAVSLARRKGIPIFFIRRVYRADGSDVELTRYRGWRDGGRAMTPGSAGCSSDKFPPALSPQPGDYTIVKPRWSAFFQTELDLLLRRLGVRTVLLAGTTTPNCIRTTCYDANALDYNVGVLTDCCSARTEEIQRVNLEDMARMGAVLLTSGELAQYSAATIPDQAEAIRAELAGCPLPPEPVF